MNVECYKVHLYMTVPERQLDGLQFKIYAKANNEFWHYNGAGTHRIVSSLAQPNDNYVRFIFEKQVDGTYKIKVCQKYTHL